MCFQCLPFFSAPPPLPESAPLLHSSSHIINPTPPLSPHLQPSYSPPPPQLIHPHPPPTALPIHESDQLQPPLESPKKDLLDCFSDAPELPSLLQIHESQQIEQTQSGPALEVAKHEIPQQLSDTSHSWSLPVEDASVFSVPEVEEKLVVEDQPLPAVDHNFSHYENEHAESETSLDVAEHELPVEQLCETSHSSSSTSDDAPLHCVPEVDEKPEVENEPVPALDDNFPQHEYDSSTSSLSSSPSQKERKHGHRQRLSQHLHGLRQQMKEEGNRLHNLYSGAKQQITEIRSVLSHSQDGP